MTKKSLNGFKLSAIKREMGLAANATPAIKAPISSDKPIFVQERTNQDTNQ